MLLDNKTEVEKNEPYKVFDFIKKKTLQKAIVGEFLIKDIISHKLGLLWELTKEYAGIDKNYFYEYFKNKDKGHAIKVKEIIQFENKKQLEDFSIKYPPQSYMYV